MKRQEALRSGADAGPRAPLAAWDVTRCQMLLHSPPEGTGGSTAL